MAHVRVLGIDIAKQIFPVVGMDDTGTAVLRSAFPRERHGGEFYTLPDIVDKHSRIDKRSAKALK